MIIPTLFAGWQACTPEELATKDQIGLLGAAFLILHIAFNLFLLWLVVKKVKRKTTKILLGILIIIVAVIVGFVGAAIFVFSGPWCN